MNGPGLTGRPAEQDVRPGLTIRAWPDLRFIAGHKEGQTQVAFFYLGQIPDLPSGTPFCASCFRTDKGINSFSCREEVVKAYGRPNSEKVAKSGAQAHIWRLVYDRLGIAFLIIPIVTTWCPSGDGVAMGLNLSAGNRNQHLAVDGADHHP